VTEPTDRPYPEGSLGAHRRTSGLAIASLVCGIAAFVAIPVIGSIAAIVLGHSARKEIERTFGLEGEGYASAGIILGWIGVGLLVLGIVGVIALTALSGGSEIGTP
jgi:hypothetical protein